MQQLQKRRRQRLFAGGIAAALVIVVIVVLIVALSPAPKKVATPPTSTTVVTTTTTTASQPPVSVPLLVAPAKIGCPKLNGSSPHYTRFAAAPKMCINPAKDYTATMVTDVGTVRIKLDAAKDPATVNNFVFLAGYHFYDGTAFHRVIVGFMDQGGDPTGTGSGSPGYSFNGGAPKSAAVTPPAPLSWRTRAPPAAMAANSSSSSARGGPTPAPLQLLRAGDKRDERRQQDQPGRRPRRQRSRHPQGRAQGPQGHDQRIVNRRLVRAAWLHQGEPGGDCLDGGGRGPGGHARSAPSGDRHASPRRKAAGSAAFSLHGVVVGAGTSVCPVARWSMTSSPTRLPSSQIVTLPWPTFRHRPSLAHISAVRSSIAAMRRPAEASLTVRWVFSSGQVLAWGSTATWEEPQAQREGTATRVDHRVAQDHRPSRRAGDHRAPDHAATRHPRPGSPSGRTQVQDRPTRQVHEPRRRAPCRRGQRPLRPLGARPYIADRSAQTGKIRSRHVDGAPGVPVGRGGRKDDNLLGRCGLEEFRVEGLTPSGPLGAADERQRSGRAPACAYLRFGA